MSSKINQNDNGEIAVETEPNLTPVQSQAVTMLLCGLTQTWAAKQLNVAPETISRWANHNADFVAAIRRGQKAQSESVDNALSELALDAVQTLAELLKSKSPRMRLAAARAILSARPAAPVGNVSVVRIADELRTNLKKSTIDSLLAEFEF